MSAWKSFFLAFVAYSIVFFDLLRGVNAAVASTFVSSNSRHNVTFSINLPNIPSTPNDFYFHISGPSSHSWIAFGFGDQMKNAFMFIVYTNKSGKNVTLSPRVATGHVEPSEYRSPVNWSPELLPPTDISDGRYRVTGICHNCQQWDRGTIDFNSTSQPMIYAVGPDDLNLNSDSRNAGLRRHDYWGSFRINMQTATGDNLPWPPDTSRTSNATENGRPHNDHEYASGLHGIAMAGTFVVILPVGALYLRTMRKIRWHWITQTIGIIVLVIGAALGLSLSHFYNRSKNYNSAHQLIGLIVVFFVLLQALLGFFQHRIFKAKQQHSIVGTVHRFLGVGVICIGIINGGLGFNLASASRHNIGYGIVIAVVFLILAGAYFLQMRRRRHREVYETPAARNFQSAYSSQPYGNDIPLDQRAGPPPAYGRPVGI